MRSETSAGVEETAGAEAFVGRQREVRRLRDAVERAIAGEGGIVLVAGEAGIGKTRLVREATRGAGIDSHWSACWEGDGVPALWPWAQVLRSLGAGDADLLSGVASASPSSLGATGPLRSEERFRAFDRIARSVIDRAAHEPLILVIDDLHWADEASLRLLAFLSPELRNAPVLIVGTYRDTELDAVRPLAALLPDLLRTAEQLSLVGLAESDVADWLVAVDEGDARRAATILHRHTGGNPFFLRELVQLLVAEGRMHEVGSRSRLSIPPSVGTVVARRLARTSHDTHELLTLAAIAGGEPEVATIALASGRPTADVLAAVDEARQCRLVRDAAEPGRFAFCHALVRRALYDAVPRSARALLHRSIGEALERLGVATDRPAEAAYHLLEAASGGDPAVIEKALHFATIAADQANQLAAYEDTAAWAGRALEVVRSVGRGETRAAGDLLCTLAEAQLGLGEREPAQAAYRDAAALARRIDDGELLGLAALGLGSGLGGFEVDVFDHTLIDLLEEASERVPSSDSALRAWLLARLTVALSFAGEAERRVALSNEAVETARRAGDMRVLGYALASRCDAIAGPDHCETRENMAREIVDLGHRTSDLRLILLGRRLLVAALLEQGRVVEVDSQIDAFERDARVLRHPLYEWYVPLWRSMGALAAGDIETAVLLTSEAEAIGARAGSENARQLVGTQRWLQLRAEGKFAESAAVMGAVFADWIESVGHSGWLGILLLQQGEHDRAAPLVRRFLDHLIDSHPDAEWLPSMATAAEATIAIGDRELAALVRQRVEPYAHRFVVEGIGAGLCGSISWYLARLARFLGDDDAAIAHERDAAAIHLAAGIAADPPLLVDGDQRRPVVEVPGVGALEREGGTWALRYAGRTARLSDRKGLRDLAVLLAAPGVDVHCVELAGAVVSARASSGDAVLDATALAAYRQRLLDLEDDIAAADAANDIGRVERLSLERDALVDELASSVGLGGRSRRFSDPAERARKTVQARLRDCIAKVGDAHPDLGRHLTNSIRTGTWCSYRPERPVIWSITTRSGD